MSLDAIIREATDPVKTFTLYRREQQSDLETVLGTLGVSLRQRPLPPNGPEPFVTIKSGDTFVGAISVASLHSLLEPPIKPPGEKKDFSPGYRALFDVLDRTVYTALKRSQLLAVSREIEDRAHRVGTGTLRVGFQRLSAYASRIHVYRELASATTLDIHIYGVEDWEPPEIPGITYQSSAGEAYEEYWVLSFISGKDPSEANGLVAREETDGYRGVWTDDPAVVNEIAKELERG